MTDELAVNATLTGECPLHREPWVTPAAPDGYRRCTFYVPEFGVSEDYGCPQEDA